MHHIITTTGYCRAWGAARNARCVYGLTAVERALIRAGGRVLLENCPPVGGVTTRQVVEVNGRFYARMPR